MADTITLKDGKWNLSKFQVDEYVTSNKSLVKIAEDKSISDVVITDAKMEVGEVYIENTKENIEEYNKNEYAFMYVKTDKFYRGYVMKNMLKYLGGDTEIPPDVEEPANPGIEYEKTIKSQTEYAENNNLKLSKAFTEINTELKKDDNLIASDLFDVDRCIEELKKSRKRWARGTFKITSSEILDIGERGVNVMFYAEVPAQFEMDSIFIYSHLNIIKGATSSGGEYNNSVAYNEIKDTKDKFPVLYGKMFGNSKYFTNGRIDYTEIDGTSKVPVLKYCFDYYRDDWADKNLVEEINRILSPNFKIDVFGR